MFQPRVSQTILYHSIESTDIWPFNIRIYDRPKELGGEMWQVHWWRGEAGGDDDEQRIHTDWNVSCNVVPDYGDEEVCVPGWFYWFNEHKVYLPLENELPPISRDQSSVFWSRDAQGDVDLVFDLGDYWIPGSGF